MSDVIQLLSDHLANQIAAGEVIQRPSSAVKELLENAVDAGATDIQLILKDAGKELIQVVDNGKGMSPTDARMSFERHATSKIRNIEDLFRIRSMGFRGEALASIAAVAQVELKTCPANSDIGTRICIEGTEVKRQEPCATVPGTNIMVKNLFYNIPARKRFLKSNTTEMRHIIDEFTRVALAYSGIAFRMIHNGAEQFHLEAGNLKTRIIGLLGATHEKNLVPTEEDTELLRIKGFIGKPSAATRTRGMQFFFVNNRFIRSPYLHHAVLNAYEGLISKETFPFYVLFLETDPARVDVNVHPTKQEVKFDDEKMMYAYLTSAVKHALARYNIAPAIDFTLNTGITSLSSVTQPQNEQQLAQTQQNYLYNAFLEKNQAHFIEKKNGMKQWNELYRIAQKPEPVSALPSEANLHPDNPPSAIFTQDSLIVHGSLMITTVKSGLMVIHIRRAQERIWYDRLYDDWSRGHATSQQQLYPQSLELNPHDALLLKDALGDLARIGFDIGHFGGNSFVLRGTPTGFPSGAEKVLLDEVVDQLRLEASHVTSSAQAAKWLIPVARRLSRNIEAIKQAESRQALVDELFASSQPEFTPDGKKIFSLLSKEALDNLLG